jgi:hypothetical protein
LITSLRGTDDQANYQTGNHVGKKPHVTSSCNPNISVATRYLRNAENLNSFSKFR